MRKNKNGITLISLVLTIIVMLILSFITLSGSNIIDRALTQKITSNMLLIQTKVKIINERVAFNGETSIYIGLKLKDQANKSAIANGVLTGEELESDYFYVYNRTTLDSIGLEGIELSNNEVFIVDYNSCDVIWPNGVKNDDGQTVYRLSELIY